MAAIEIILRLAGAFYAIAGFLIMRAARMDHLLDKAIEAISGRPTPRAERTRSDLMTATAVMTTAAGTALLVGSAWAAPLFAAALAVLIGGHAWEGRADPPADESERLGRRRSINATLLFAAVTAGVAWFWTRGGLAGFGDPARAGAILISAAAVAAYGWRATRWNPSGGTSAFNDTVDGEAEEASSLALMPARIRIAPRPGDWPLRDADEDAARNHFRILPPELADRIEKWDEGFQMRTEIDAADGSVRFETPEYEAGFEAEGKAIRGELEVLFGEGMVEGPVLPGRPQR